MSNGISRRRLMQTTAALSLAGLPEWYVARAEAAEQERAADQPRRIGPNDTINVAAIGVGGSRGGYRQGLGDTRAAAGQKGVKVVAICDIDQTHLKEALAIFGPDCKGYSDFRSVLSRSDIDAVVIGVPDFWHAIVATHALRAGKDVYCEKPLTLTIDEGKHLVKTVAETGKVFQTGSQQRSDGRFRMACELVRNGRIGKLKSVRAQIPTAPKAGPFPVEAPPSDFNWEFWQGPVQPTEYVKRRTHGDFRYWYEYAGGMVTDWGAHHNDIAQWGMGTDGSGPIKISSVGTAPKFDPHSFNVHTDFDITYTYANGVTLLCTNKGENGVRFEGEDGKWIFVSRSKIEASDPKLLSDPLPENATKLYVSNNHMGNFVDCIRTREKPICNVEVGHRSVSVCHLGNISLRLGGKTLNWDPATETFKNDAEATAMLSRPHRGDWAIL